MSYRNYSEEFRGKVVAARISGISHKIIAKQFAISSATSRAWTGDMVLTREAQQKIKAAWYEKYWAGFLDYRNKNPEEYRKLLNHNLTSFKQKYSPEDLLNAIKDFYKVNKRIPFKREFNQYKEYKKHFGSWNNAIESAGFRPNQVIFSRKSKAADGHICDSLAETLIDDWLSKNKVPHGRNYQYGVSKLTADFKLSSHLIEYFGMAGQNKKYDNYILTKRRRAEELGLTLVEIYPKELFRFKNGACKYLDQALGFLVKL